MAFKSLMIFAVLVSILANAAFGAIVGGWKPIKNPNDPVVVEIAKFAVAEHNKKDKDAVVFVSVIKGETQVVAGTKYRLFISGKQDATSPLNSEYLTVVWDNPSEKSKELLTFYKFTNNAEQNN